MENGKQEPTLSDKIKHGLDNIRKSVTATAVAGGVIIGASMPAHAAAPKAAEAPKDPISTFFAQFTAPKPVQKPVAKKVERKPQPAAGIVVASAAGYTSAPVANRTPVAASQAAPAAPIAERGHVRRRSDVTEDKPGFFRQMVSFLAPSVHYPTTRAEHDTEKRLRQMESGPYVGKNKSQQMDGKVVGLRDGSMAQYTHGALFIVPAEKHPTAAKFDISGEYAVGNGLRRKMRNGEIFTVGTEVMGEVTKAGIAGVASFGIGSALSGTSSLVVAGLQALPAAGLDTLADSVSHQGNRELKKNPRRFWTRHAVDTAIRVGTSVGIRAVSNAYLDKQKDIANGKIADAQTAYNTEKALKVHTMTAQQARDLAQTRVNNAVTGYNNAETIVGYAQPVARAGISHVVRKPTKKAFEKEREIEQMTNLGFRQVHHSGKPHRARTHKPTHGGYAPTNG